MSNPLKIIDISQPTKTISSSLLEAAQQQGFLFVDGHNFTQDEVDALFQVSQDFFTQTPDDVKGQYAIKSNNIGYTHFTNEQLDPSKARDFKEAYNFGNINFKTGTFNQSDLDFNGHGDNDNVVPPILEQHRAMISNTIQKLHQTAMRILNILCEGLEVEDREFFAKKHRPDQPSGCVFRMLRYPLVREDHSSIQDYDATIRAGAHTDYGSLTLLFQRRGQQGLQLQTEGPGNEPTEEWAEVPFVESQHDGKAPPLVVNFGDLLSYWTNGVLKSTYHRVKFTPGETRTKDRYSIVFFVHPEHATELTPVPSRLVADHASGLTPPTITAAEHLQKRLEATYSS
ncbi:LADA_0B02168g1_1 [Lachancea dasiensis]|uniref:LADA_0B02168g1_1 n=1 Tax=Lachancea dasiensis TaxID=1072105 RepID=A0A1G4ISK8_9SACH|nr:LADA_0B02168g1_1 [Lachancea dasiensis]